MADTGLLSLLPMKFQEHMAQALETEAMYHAVHCLKICSSGLPNATAALKLCHVYPASMQPFLNGQFCLG